MVVSRFDITILALLSTRYAIGISDLGVILAERLGIKVLPIEAKTFLDFVRTEEGADILKSNGYLPN